MRILLAALAALAIMTAACTSSEGDVAAACSAFGDFTAATAAVDQTDPAAFAAATEDRIASLEALAANVPGDLADDAQTMREGLGAFADVIAEAGWTPSAAQAAAAQQALNDVDGYTESVAAVSAWVSDNCEL